MVKKKEIEEEEVEKKTIKSEDKPEDKEDKCHKEKDDKEDEKKEVVKSADEDEDDYSDMDEEEKSLFLKLKAKVKKKIILKAEELSPEKGAAQVNTGGNTMSPGAGVPSKPQDVFVPDSSVEGKREQSTPMDKSISPDLLKSPLWLSLNKQMDGIQDALVTKIDALQKSVDDRMKNIKTDMEKIEKFYSQSFYKSASDEVGPEGLKAQTISKQIEDGKVHFRAK